MIPGLENMYRIMNFHLSVYVFHAYILNRLSFVLLPSLKAAMTSIQTAATNCRYTTLLASQLGSLTIKDVAFAQFFVMFPNVDTFCRKYLSHLRRKPTICICENKDADQLRGNREADQRLYFRYTDSTLPLLLKSEISSF